MDWDKARLFSHYALGQDEEAEAKQDGIRRWDHNERKNLFRWREGAHPD